MTELFIIALWFHVLDGVNSQIKKCDYLETYKQHYANFKDSDIENKYIPHISCFTCTVPNCDFADRRCVKTSSSMTIPVYHHLLEFGVYYFKFQKSMIANVAFERNCGLQILAQKSTSDPKNRIFLFWKKCLNDFKDCREIHKFDYPNLQNKDSCMFFTFKFFKTGWIYEASTSSCTLSSTNNLKDEKTFRHFDCPHTDETSLTVKYTVFHNDDSTEDGIPIILPCSPGGYAVSPTTGRFVSGPLCRVLFRDIQGGISLIIRKFYNNSEQYTFPYYDKTDKMMKLENKIPVYFNDHGKTAFSEKEMSENSYICNFTIVRDGCTVSIKPINIEAIRSNKKCLDEYNERVVEQKTDENVPKGDIKDFLLKPLKPEKGDDTILGEGGIPNDVNEDYGFPTPGELKKTTLQTTTKQSKDVAGKKMGVSNKAIVLLSRNKIFYLFFILLNFF